MCKTHTGDDKMSDTVVAKYLAIESRVFVSGVCVSFVFSREFESCVWIRSHPLT